MRRPERKSPNVSWPRLSFGKQPYQSINSGTPRSRRQPFRRLKSTDRTRSPGFLYDNWDPLYSTSSDASTQQLNLPPSNCCVPAMSHGPPRRYLGLPLAGDGSGRPAVGVQNVLRESRWLIAHRPHRWFTGDMLGRRLVLVVCFTVCHTGSCFQHAAYKDLPRCIQDDPE